MSVDRAARAGAVHASLRERSARVQAFASALKSFVVDAGFDSARSLAKEAHLSHETVAAAFRGKTLPTALVLECVLSTCGASPQQRREWEEARSTIAALLDGSESQGPRDDPSDGHAHIEEYAPVVDHADPDDSGCFRDAVTVVKQRIRRRGTRNYLGWVELRYCPAHGAAWARFHGLDALTAVAAKHAVDVYVAVHRASDGQEDGFRHPFAHDYHWSGMLLVGDGDVYAEAQIYEDCQLIGRADTRRLRVAAADVDLGHPKGLTGAERMELVELRQRILILETENESLRRASAHHAAETLHQHDSPPGP